MIGSLLDHWKYTWTDLWTVMAKSRRAPPDLFIELFRTASDFLVNPPVYKQFELTMNDPAQAKQAFQQIRAQDLGSELTVIGFMESAFQTVGEFEIKFYQKLYKRLVKSFINKYNLPYRVDDPFRLRLVLPGVFASFYAELGRLHATDAHLRGLMSDFEQAFGSYVRTKQAHELKACITSAFIYAEGLAGKTSGQIGPLGELCDHIQCWPHATVRKSLKTLYGFRNDYPGLGHGSNPKGKLRELEPRDAIVICLLLLSYSGYLSNEVQIENTLAL